MAAERVGFRFVTAEPRDVGVERRPTDHPGGVIDDPAVPSLSRRVGDAVPLLLRERPERGQVVPRGTGGLEPLSPVLKSLGDFLRAQGPGVDRRSGEIAVEELRRDAPFARGGQPQGAAPADAGPAKGC